VNPRQATTILLVDDDSAWRAALERCLQAEGMRGIGLGRAEWITSAIETHQPDAVLLDINLPGIDGLRALETVRHRWPQLPVIIMTAFGGRETGDVVRQSGATAYLEKPFRLSDLIAQIERATGTARPSTDEAP
jgi:two-component system nitrogen regulation response regulator GlnG